MGIGLMAIGRMTSLEMGNVSIDLVEACMKVIVSMVLRTMVKAN